MSKFAVSMPARYGMPTFHSFTLSIRFLFPRSPLSLTQPTPTHTMTNCCSCLGELVQKSVKYSQYSNKIINPFS